MLMIFDKNELIEDIGSQMPCIAVLEVGGPAPYGLGEALEVDTIIRIGLL